MKYKKQTPSNLQGDNFCKRLPAIPKDNNDALCPTWTFDMIDRNGVFAFDINRQDFNAKLFFDKLISFSNMTWSEIMRQTHDKGKSSNHFLDVDGMSKEARSRYEFMQFVGKYDEQVFSLRLNNTTRVIGIRDGRIFHVVWYDENHKFYPSNKNHT